MFQELLATCERFGAPTWGYLLICRRRRTVAERLGPGSLGHISSFEPQGTELEMG